MIDFHSHILPNVDDGSKDVEESIDLLNMLSRQNVETVIATPHFLANHEPIDRFLQRRSESVQQLLPELKDGHPKIICGAEVSYYPGISRMEGLDKLRIEGSKLLLLEMPMCKWSDYALSELAELAARGSTRIVLAHLERYMGFQKDSALRTIYQNGILVQCNASFLLEFGTKRRAMSMLGDGRIHMLGSDCHSVKSRPPRIGNAFEAIEKKFGRDFLNNFNEYGYSLLDENI